jgi:hypothetical protein
MRASYERAESPRTAAVGAPPLGGRPVVALVRDGGLPTPKRVLEWYRLLHAARHIEAGTRKREAVARRVGLTSGEALGSALHHYGGISWRQLREEVGFTGLLKRFESILRRPRPARFDVMRDHEPNSTK